MRKLFFIALLLSGFITRGFSQVVINEVMYAPTSPHKEWFEIYNNGTSSVNLQNWKWRDAAVSNPIRTITTSSVVLNAGQYAIICEDSANLRQAFPSITGIVLQSIGWNALNNSGNENVVLYDASNLTSDSLTYTNSWGGSNGNSLERKLASGPTNQQTNWGTSIDPSGATPDRKNSLSPKNYDLILSAFTITPSNPIVGGNVSMQCVIKNAGALQANNFELNLYRDINLDSIPASSEIINSNNFSSLNAGDSTVYTFSYQIPDINSIQYIAKVIFSQDEDTLNNLIVKRITIGGGGIIPTGLVINEVMYAPLSPNKEWFEIFNGSTSGVNLQNYKWKDAAASNPYRTITSQSVIIPSGGYAVICEDSVNLRLAYPSITGLVLQSIGWNALNNTGNENVVLYNSSYQIVDSLTYADSWGGTNGRSLERINPAENTNLQSNWGSCISPSKATPGTVNSLTPKDYDLALSNFLISPSSPQKDDILNLQFTVKNIGLNTSSNSSLNIYFDANFNGIPETSEIMNSYPLPNINKNDSVYYSYRYQSTDTSALQFIGRVIYPNDMDTTNNTLIKKVIFGNYLAINEIMYDPATGSAEYVEIFNPTSKNINLTGLKLWETSSSTNIYDSLYFEIQSGSFLLVASDSTIYTKFPFLRDISPNNKIFFNKSLSLSNSGDTLKIIDASGTIIDFVAYSPKWNNPNIADTKGKSLERINPLLNGNDKNNWNTCVDSYGGTPLRQNSIYSSLPVSQGKITISPNPFSPDGDGFEDVAIIDYSIPQQVAQLRVKVYDAKGRLVRTLANNLPSGSKGQIIFNGLNDSGERLRIGIYIVYLEALDSRGGSVETIKSTVVVATKL